MLGAIRRWLRRKTEEVEEATEGGIPVATSDGVESETSTNAQVEGASGEPWPGRDPDT